MEAGVPLSLDDFDALHKYYLNYLNSLHQLNTFVWRLVCSAGGVSEMLLKSNTNLKKMKFVYTDCKTVALKTQNEIETAHVFVDWRCYHPCKSILFMKQVVSHDS